MWLGRPSPAALLPPPVHRRAWRPSMAPRPGAGHPRLPLDYKTPFAPLPRPRSNPSHYPPLPLALLPDLERPHVRNRRRSLRRFPSHGASQAPRGCPIGAPSSSSSTASILRTSSRRTATSEAFFHLGLRWAPSSIHHLRCFLEPIDLPCRTT